MLFTAPSVNPKNFGTIVSIATFAESSMARRPGVTVEVTDVTVAAPRIARLPRRSLDKLSRECILDRRLSSSQLILEAETRVLRVRVLVASNLDCTGPLEADPRGEGRAGQRCT